LSCNDLCEQESEAICLTETIVNVGGFVDRRRGLLVGAGKRADESDTQ
jgi:hypothetical protein